MFSHYKRAYNQVNETKSHYSFCRHWSIVCLLLFFLKQRKQWEFFFPQSSRTFLKLHCEITESKWRLTCKAVGWTQDSEQPGQHCHLSETPGHKAPPTSSYSKAHNQVTTGQWADHKKKREKEVVSELSALEISVYYWCHLRKQYTSQRGWGKQGFTQMSVRSSTMQWLSTLKSSGAL